MRFGLGYGFGLGLGFGFVLGLGLGLGFGLALGLGLGFGFGLGEGGRSHPFDTSGEDSSEGQHRDGQLGRDGGVGKTVHQAVELI